MLDYTMKSIVDSLRNRPINVNRTFFYITMIFVGMGLASSTAVDLQIGNPLLIVTDFLALGFFALCFLLVHRFRANPALILFACVLVATILYYLGFFTQWYNRSATPRIWDDVAMNILLTGVLGSSCGLVLLRNGAPIYMLIGLGFLGGVFSMSSLNREAGHLVFMGVLLFVTLLVVLYFRTNLETLMVESTGIINATRFLKDKQESQNEQNRPFVYFGQNSVGLVMDFRTDVDRMQEHLNVLKLQDSDRDEQVRILQHMEEQARFLSHRIDLVNFITSAGPDRPPEQLKIHQVFEAALYPFRINPRIRDWVQVRCETPLDLDTHDRRYDWLHLVELIMRQTLSPDLDGSHHLDISFLVTASREQIRVAYGESRPAFFAQPVSRIRSFNQPADQLRTLVSGALGGGVEVLDREAGRLVVNIPRRYRS